MVHPGRTCFTTPTSEKGELYMLFKRNKSQETEVETPKVVEPHVLNILDSTGHTTITFDPTSEVEVEETRKKFNEIMAAQHGLAYKVSDGESETIREFDPDAKEQFITPQIQGG